VASFEKQVERNLKAIRESMKERMTGAKTGWHLLRQATSAREGVGSRTAEEPALFFQLFNLPQSLLPLRWNSLELERRSPARWNFSP